MNIYEYCTQGMFYQKYHTSFDLIVDEKRMIGWNMDFSLDGKIALSLQKSQRSVVILDSVSLSLILPLIISLIKESKLHNCLIINTTAGITNISHVYSPDFKDVDNVIDYFSVWECVDMALFHEIVEGSGYNYIRVPSQEIEDQIFSSDQTALFLKAKFLDMSAYQFQGSDGTILFFGNQFNTMISVGNALFEYGKKYDMFCILEYHIEAFYALSESLKKNHQCLVIIDMDKDSRYVSWLEKFLYSHGNEHLRVRFLTPDIKNLTTYLDDYITEKALFDAPALVQRILGS